MTKAVEVKLNKDNRTALLGVTDALTPPKKGNKSDPVSVSVVDVEGGKHEGELIGFTLDLPNEQATVYLAE